MNDLVINRDSGGAIHLNKNKKMNNASKELLNKSAVETPVPLHKQLVSWAQMNTSKEHFSPTYADIIPQNAKDLSKNPLLSFIKPENRPDISQNPFLNIDAKNNINRNFIEADKGRSLKSAGNEIIPQSNKNNNSLLFC